MIARALALVLALGGVLVAAGSARAESAAQREARDHYYRGMTHYDLAEYDAAIVEFKTAYELSHEPGLLFNLAQVSRLKKDYEGAAHFYETFLSLNPKAANRADAEAQLARMRQLAAEHPSAPPPARVKPPTTTPAPVVARPPEFLATTRGRVSIALFAGGGALLLTSAVTGGLALSDRGQYDRGCDAGRCDAALYSKGYGLAIGTDVLITVGVVAVATAVVLVLTRPRERRPMVLGMAF